MNKICSYGVLICFIQSFNIYGQDINTILDAYSTKKVDYLEKTWCHEGYWGEAKEKKDNRFNEAILIYSLKENFDNDYYKLRIRKAIFFSIRHLQDSITGGFYENNRPNHVRTSLFLNAIATVISKHPEIYENLEVQSSIHRAVKFISTPQEFSSNHNLAALMSLSKLHEVTCDNVFADLLKEYREVIIKDFIFDQDYKSGYWPEAPKRWKNRLNVPYLLVQLMFVQQYLQTNKKEDEKIDKLYKAQLRKLSSLVNYKNFTLDVRQSYGKFKNKDIKFIKFSVPSIFFNSSMIDRIPLDNRKEFLLKCLERFDNDIKKYPALLNSDLYYRFLIINK
ncbi:hypothetical protein [Maribacter dokdonensis]|uniref:hypothetical protein n=1 Tax=Maribacter dokdonensis TaxID=320912 RepID=UPI001C08CB56|nr:hypothetical protein [Maribacter dokdonensis]MBU2900552.1 hypothetical protein [Maribacter dokdonensis]